MSCKSAPDAGRILVTGAAGFLGGEIVRQGRAAGLTVRATDVRCHRQLGDTECCYANILDPNSLSDATSGIDAVIHAAGLAHVFRPTQEDARRYSAINVVGTTNMAEACAHSGVRHLILVSSVAVYGGSRPDHTETVPCIPKGPYAESKWQAEQQAIEITRSAGIQLTILRLATLYGEGDPGNVVRLIRTIAAGRFVWIGDGANWKCLLHRDDAARACLAALSRSDGGVKIYNVAATPCTVRQIVETTAQLLRQPLRQWRVPGVIASAVAQVSSVAPGRLAALSMVLKKWLADDIYDGSRFERTFGFSPQVTLEAGLYREVAWYRNLYPDVV